MAVTKAIACLLTGVTAVTAAAVVSVVLAKRNRQDEESLKKSTTSSKPITFPWEPASPSEDGDENHRSKNSTRVIATANNKEMNDDDENRVTCIVAGQSQRQHVPFGSSTPRQKHKNGNDDDELLVDFLASMSFANGGLRSPTCPCCI